MPIFEEDGKRIRVKDEDVEKFSQRHPNATIKLSNGGGDMTLSAGDYYNFASRMSRKRNPAEGQEPQQQQQQQQPQQPSGDAAAKQQDAPTFGQMALNPMGISQEELSTIPGIKESKPDQGQLNPYDMSFAKALGIGGGRRNMTVSGQLDYAEAKLAELQKKLEARNAEVRKSVDEKLAGKSKLGRAAERVMSALEVGDPNSVEMRGSFAHYERGGGSLLQQAPYMEASMLDNETKMLESAIRQKQEEIKTLKARRADMNGRMGWGNFWSGAAREVIDPTSWDSGAVAFRDAEISLLNRDELDEKGKAAYDEMLNARQANQQAEAEFDSKGYQYGRVLGKMAPYMADFIMTRGGFKGITRLFTGLGEKGSARLIGKATYDAIQNVGLKDYVRSNGFKGFMQYGTNWGVKALGENLDDLLVRAPMMTATRHPLSVSADAIMRHLGDVGTDSQGNPTFTGGMSWGRAFYQATANDIIENASEMMGEHMFEIPFFNVRKPLTKMFGKTRADVLLASWKRGLENAGISDITGEIREEYRGQFWKSLLGVDDAWQWNEDGSRGKNLLFTPGFNFDTVAGITLSMGGMMPLHLMGSVGSMRAYKSMVHAVNRADITAGELFEESDWEKIRTLIDNTKNEDMGSMVTLLQQGSGYDKRQRDAICDYAESLTALRGFNIGSTAVATGRQYLAERQSDVRSGKKAIVTNGKGQALFDDKGRIVTLEKGQQRQFTTPDGTEGTGTVVADDKGRIVNDDGTVNFQTEGGVVAVSVNNVGTEEGENWLDYNPKQEEERRQKQEQDQKVIENAEQSYLNGQQAAAGGDPQEMNDTKNLMESLRVQLNFLSEERQARLDSDPMGVLEEYRKDVAAAKSGQSVMEKNLELIVSYINARQAYEGMMQGVRDDMDGKVAQSDAMVDSRTHEDGTVKRATLKDGNRVVYIIKGKVGLTDDGKMVSTSADKSDNVLIVRDEQTGKVEMVAPNAILSMDDAQPADVVKQTAAEAIRQQTAKEAADKIDGVATFNPGDTYTITDEDGTQHEVQVVGVNEDGSVTVTDGQNTTAVQKEVLQQAKDAEGQQRVADFTKEQQQEQEQQQQPAEQQSQAAASEEERPQATATEQQQQQPTASERIPRDEEGELLYEQAETPDLAWDALVEQSGDEEVAQAVAEAQVKKMEKAVKAAEKAKTKETASVAEEIAAQKELKAARAAAKRQLAIWQQIAGTQQRRAEERKAAEEAQKKVEAEAEKQRKEEAQAKKEADMKAREEKQRRDQESLKGVPDMTLDKPQDARARGYRRVDGERVDRQEPVKKVEGKAVEVKFSQKETAKGHVVLISADDLQPSHTRGKRNPRHFIDEAQPKERTDTASMEAASKMAADIRPEEVTSSVTAFTGAPTVNARGEVIQGNNRSAALKEMYETQKEQAEKYKRYLKEHAAEFGLTAEQIDSVKNPVLVNMMDVDDDTAIRLGQYVAQDTESGGVERIKPQNTLKKMGKDTRTFANMLMQSADDEESFTALVDKNGVNVLKWLAQKGYITATQYRSALNSKGDLTDEAKNDLKQILYQGIFQGGSTRLEEMFAELPAKAQKAILATAYRDYDSPEQESVRKELQESITAYHLLMLDPDFRAAKNMEATQRAVRSWELQSQFDDATGEPYLPSKRFSNFALALAAMYKGATQKQIQQSFNQLYDLIQGTQEGSLFETPDNKPRTLAQAIKETFNIDYNGEVRSGTVAVDSTASQTGREGTAGNAQSGERGTQGKEPADSGRGTDSVREEQRGKSGEVKTGEEPATEEQQQEQPAKAETEQAGQQQEQPTATEGQERPAATEQQQQPEAPEEAKRQQEGQPATEGQERPAATKQQQQEKPAEEGQSQIRKAISNFTERVGKMYDSLVKKGFVHIIGSLEELNRIAKENGYATVSEKDESTVRGFYAGGKAYLYAPGIYLDAKADGKDPIKAFARALAHELFAHKGLREMLGKQEYDKFCDAVFKGMDKADRAHYIAYHWNYNLSEAERAEILKELGIEGTGEERWDKLSALATEAILGNKKYRDMMQRGAADEFCARLAERVAAGEHLKAYDKTAWEKFCDAIRRVLGIGKDTLTDKDVAEALLESKQRIEDKAEGKETQEERGKGAAIVQAAYEERAKYKTQEEYKAAKNAELEALKENKKGGGVITIVWEKSGDVGLFSHGSGDVGMFSYKGGKFEGAQCVWNKDGQLRAERNYEDDVQVGMQRDWYANGQIKREMLYKKTEDFNSKKQNAMRSTMTAVRSWYENGQQAIDWDYERTDGVNREWYGNGQLKERSNYKNGNRLEEKWDENGQLRERNNYKNHKHDGLQEMWHSNGQLRYRHNYKNGEWDGLQEKWDRDGNLESRENYKDGKRVLFSVSERKGKRRKMEEPKSIGLGENGDIYDWSGRKPADAFRFLYKRKSGDLRNVFYRKEIGSIDLIWGNDSGGLCHIINKHIKNEGNSNADYKDINDMINHIVDVVEHGNIEKREAHPNTPNKSKDTINTRYIISFNGYLVIIRSDYNGKGKNWIVSSYDSNVSSSKKETATNPFSRSHGANGAESYAIHSFHGKDSDNPQTAKGNSDKNNRMSVSERIDRAAADTDTNPTDAQKETGNYRKGHVRVAGFDLSIENPEGSVRSGTDANGRKWETRMNNTYGYILGTKGTDGDHIDTFLSNDMDAWDNENAFVVDQYNPDGTFDEHKVMLGFNDSASALQAYLSNYEKGWADGRRIDISSVSMDGFKDWVDSSTRKTKAFADYKNVDKETREAGQGGKDNEVRFSVSHKGGFDFTTTSDGKSLVGIHNISQRKLRKALKLGGLANPSVAVTDMDKGGHEGYGEVSLILPPLKLDKKKGRNAGTWLGDAYTPMYPEVTKRIGRGGRERLKEDLDKLPKEMRSAVGDFTYDWTDDSSVNQLSYMFLHERGEAPEMVVRNGKVDPNETMRQARDYMRKNGLADEFEKWRDSLDERYDVKGGIFTGEFTPTGLRKYVPETLKSISAYMKKEGRAGAHGGIFGMNMGQFIAKTLGQETTLAGIKKASSKIMAAKDDEKRREKAMSIVKNADNVLNDVTNKFKLDDYTLAERDATMEAALAPDPKAYLKKTYDVDISDEDSKRLKDMVKDISENYPFNYFETKFERPVTIDEFAAAVVPENVDEDIKRALQDKGIDVATYKADDEEDRKRAVDEVTKTHDLRFSVSERARNGEEYLSEDEKAKAADYLLSDRYVSELTGKEFEKSDTPLTESVIQYYKEKYGGKDNDIPNGIKLHRDELGDVVLNKQSIRDNIGHRMTRNQTIGFAAVPEVITKGIIIDSKENWKERGYGSTTIAAPIKIGNNTYIETVVVTKGKNATNFRYYLHKVTSQKKLLDELSKTGFSPDTHQEGIANVLRNILSAKQNAINIPSGTQNAENGTANLSVEKKREAYTTEEAHAILSNVKGQKQAGVNYDVDDREIRFSVGEKRKGMMRQRLEKSRPDIKEKERKALFDYLDTLGNTKLENATFKWFLNGSIKIPEDMYKVRQALQVADKAGVSFEQYDSPMQLINAFPQVTIKAERINPEEVPTLHKAKEYGGGIVVYDVDDSEDSRRNMRKIINTHFGEDCSPWCLLQGDGKGNLTENSEYYWNHYNAYPKQVAFQNGKLLAFSANDREERVWWDRQDKPHNGIPVTRKMPGDELGRTATYQLNVETGRYGEPSDIHKGNKQNGTYEEWNSEGRLVERSNYKDGINDGLQEKWYNNGQMMLRGNCKNGDLDGLCEGWWENGQLKERSNYKNDEADGLQEEWYENGQLKERSNYRNGKLEGLQEEWYYDGQLTSRHNYKNGEADGLHEGWYYDGKPSYRRNFKNGKQDGLQEIWFNNGQIRYSGNYKNDEMDGLQETWYINRQLRERSNYKNGKRDGLTEMFEENGNVTRQEYKDGFPVGEPVRMSVSERFDRASSRLAEKKVMAEQASRLADNLKLRNVNILTSVSDLPEEQRNLRGFYDQKTGRITVIVPNHDDVAGIEKTVLHEAVAHYGLRQLFGDEFDSFLDKVYREVPVETRRKIAQMAARYGWDFPRATEEYLASLAEDTDFGKAGSAWNKIKNLFRRMLRRLGFGGNGISDNELRYVLWKSYDNLRRDRGSVFAMAADIAQQSRLEVGIYDPKNRILARQGSHVEYEKSLVRDRYEHRMRSGVYQSIEAMQDSMRSLKEFMEMASGAKNVEDIEGHENAYLKENALSSVNKAQLDLFSYSLFHPMLEEAKKLYGNSKAGREELMDYMMAKHGLERNRVLAERDANEEFAAYQTEHPGGKKTLQDFMDEKRKKDYAGLTALMGFEKGEVADAERAAREMVDRYEQAHDTKALWEKVNAVNKEILGKHFKSGMMSRETYDKVRKMFDYYIPLRGFDEKTAEEEYAYLDTKGGKSFMAPYRRAEGRTSKADDPFANMMAMAEGAIAQGNRNRMVKQAFLDFVTNHPTDLVSIDDVWVKLDDVTGEWQLQTADVSSDDSPEEVERKTREFEERMRQLQEKEPDKYKHGREAESVPFRVVSSRDLREHQVMVKRGGRTYILTINGNPRLAQALNGKTNPNNEQTGAMGVLEEYGDKFNRWVSLAYTSRKPDFILSNFLRDFVYANSIVHVKEGGNYALRFHWNVERANPVRMKILLAKMRNGTLDMNNPLERQFHDFIMNGGETGYTVVRDTEHRKSDINRQLKISNAQSVPEKTVKFFTLLGMRLDELSRAIELSSRFAAFVTSREFGRDMTRSIWDAKEITVNFNKKGAGSKFLREKGQTGVGNAAAFTSGVGRAGYIFWNASIQGLTNFGKQVVKHPGKGLAFIGSFFAMGFLQGIIGMLFGGGDGDDDKNSYFNLPEYTRRSNIVIPAGKSWITIPLPQEIRAIYGMGELLVTLCFGKVHMTGGEIAESIAEQLSQPLPIDFMEGGHLSWKSALPTVIKAPVEAFSNESWTGMPIYKDTGYNSNSPEWTKVYSNANKQLVAISKSLNEKTGGTKYEKGWADKSFLNPAIIEYLLNTYLGGYFSTFDEIVKTTETLMGKRDFDPRSIPLLNRVMRQGDERTEARAINEEFYKIEEEAKNTRRIYNAYQSDTKRGIFDYADKIEFLNHSPKFARMQIYEEHKPYISSLNTSIKKAKEEGRDEDAKEFERDLINEKHKLVDEINEKMQELKREKQTARP